MKYFILIVAACACVTSCGRDTTDRQSNIVSGALYQTTPYNAMLDNIYDGEMTIGELKKYGGFGIGTFNALDGELIALDGITYQFTADGMMSVADNSKKTPFAMVTHFDVDDTIMLEAEMYVDGLTELLDSRLPTGNIFYAIMIRGKFGYVKTKSVPAQAKPYPSLAEVLLEQPKFEYTDMSGTIVGFRCPDFIEGINVPGYHFHIISDDSREGGHVIECTIPSGAVEIDYITDFSMILKRNKEFDHADMTRKISEELADTDQYEFLNQPARQGLGGKLQK